MNEILIWEGCYNQTWTGMLAEAAFRHPAKFSRGLIERIYGHCLERGWLKPGDWVGDPFAGVGTGGLIAAYRGLNWFGVELEQNFVNLARANFNLHRGKLEYLGRPLPVIVQGDSRNFAALAGKQLAGILASPPYAQSLRGLNHNGIDAAKLDPSKHHTGQSSQLHSESSYGMTEGQIERLPEGSVNAVVASPPFPQPYIGGGGINKKGYGPDGADKVGERTYQGRGGNRHPDNLESLQAGQVDAVVSSPPYADSVNAKGHGIDWEKVDRTNPNTGNRKRGPDCKHAQTLNAKLSYGETPGQIGALKAVVGSPPWESNCEGGRKAHKLRDPLKGHRGHGASDAAVLAQAKRDEQKTYGDSPGQIGNTQKETYWQAVRSVYEQCFLALRPGGLMVLVLKDYVKDKKIVALTNDTARLLAHLGFVELERARAMLAQEKVHDDLFAGQTVERTERKSFFRRLAEAKGSPRIDWETVLFFRKP